MAGQILSAQINVTLPQASIQAFEKTAASATKTEVALKKIAPTANSANLALINTGRVVQDLPFGFLGIANNLNPLLESFQRLRAETGTTGTALKALGTSLLGAGGLGFALSLVSSAFLLFGGALNTSKKHTEELKDSTDSAAESQKAFKKEMDAASAATINEASKMEDLRKTLVDTTNQYNELTKSVINRGIAQALFSEKEGIIQKQLSRIIGDQIGIQKELASVEEFRADSKFGKQLTQQEKDIADAQKKGLTVFGFVEDEKVKKIGERFKLYNDEKKQLETINNIARSLGLSFDPFIQKLKERKSDIEFTPRVDIKNRGLIESDLNKIFADIQGITIPELHIRPKDSDKLLDNLKKEVSKTPSIVEIPIDAKLKFDAELLQKQMNEINSIIGRGFQDLFSSIGEGIANLDLSNITGVLGSLIQQIGRALIQYGVVKTGLDKILKGGISIPGAVAIGLGVFAIALGQLIKNAKPQGFAEGGFTGIGGKYQPAGIVHKGEFVVPADAVSRIGIGRLNDLAFGSGIRGYANGGLVSGAGISAGRFELTSESRISGYDIVTIHKLASKSIGRNF